MSKFIALLIASCWLALLRNAAAVADEVEVNRNTTNHSFVEGDIVLTREQQLSFEQSKGAESVDRNIFGPQRLVVDHASYTWANGVVFYVLDSTITNHAQSRDVIMNAIYDYQNMTCIRFQLRNTESDYITFTKGSGCWSYIGRIGGPQQISIGRGCESKGIVIHEIFHALGRWHEQSRPDRGDHINIHSGNIISGVESNFEKVQTTSIITLQGITYDYGSIMHYRSHAFSKNGQPTITPKNSSIPLSSLGQRNGLSPRDLQHVRTQYRCSNTSQANWGSWGSWSGCTQTCNGGTQRRNRACVGGVNCVGANYESRQCNTNDCPVKPTWSSWGVWGSCSATCGTGRQSRSRSCMNGNTCAGARLEYRDCNSQACPQTPSWTSWSSWGDCSQSCRGGRRSRTRRCQNGNTCQGGSTEFQDCNANTPCTPDPSSGEWGAWSECSATCAGGTRTRSRRCGLSDTSRCTTITEDCNTQSCPDPLRGLKHLGCYAVPRSSRNLLLLENTTPDLSDNALRRQNPVSKCGLGAIKHNYTCFSVTLGFCISGSNSTSDYFTFLGPFCANGKGGDFRRILYMDVYQISNTQQYSDALQEVLYSSTVVRPSSTVAGNTATVTVTPTPQVDGKLGITSSSFVLIPSLLLLLFVTLSSLVILM